MTEAETKPAAPPIPEGNKVTAEQMVALGWKDVSPRKGRKTFQWCGEPGARAVYAQISNQGFASIIE